MKPPSDQVQLKILQAGPEHIEIAAPLFDAYRQFYRRPSDVNKAREFLSERLRRKESVLFLALMETRDVSIPQNAAGFVHLYPTYSSLSMRPVWILSDLFVTPEARQRGVGTALMDRARQLAVATRAEGLALETATDNHPAQRLYEQLGYQRDEAFYRYFLTI